MDDDQADHDAADASPAGTGLTAGDATAADPTGATREPVGAAGRAPTEATAGPTDHGDAADDDTADDDTADDAARQPRATGYPGPRRASGSATATLPPPPTNLPPPPGPGERPTGWAAPPPPGPDGRPTGWAAPPPWAGPPPWATWAPGTFVPWPVSPRPERAPRAPDPAPRQLIVLAVAGGIAFDLGLRGGLANAVVLAAAVISVIALLTRGRLPRRGARLLVLSSLVPAAFLAIRSSPWLVAGNASASAALLLAAIAFARTGSPFDTTPSRALRRLESARPGAWTAPRSLAPAIPRLSEGRVDRARRVALALLVAVPILGIVASLLASADAVFAGLVTPDVHIGPTIGHLLLTALGAGAVVAVVGSLAAEPTDKDRPGTFGTTEITTMLGLASLVLGLYVVSQLVALTGAGDRLVAQSGLTPAEYARTGFFQLCWATAFLLGFLGIVRALATADALASRGVRILSGLVPLLALGLVAGSLRRMALYDQAFGLTMLRLSVVVVTLWMGLVLVMIAARNLGLGGGRHWVLGASVAALIALVLVADLANPEAFVVRHDVARARQGVPLDGAYLRVLSPDATPALVDASRDPRNAQVRDALAEGFRCDDTPTGVASLNLSVWWANQAEDRACP